MPASSPRSAVARRPLLHRRTAYLLAGFLALAGLVALVAPPPAAAAIYRYWGYYQGGAKDTWGFDDQGSCPDQAGRRRGRGVAVRDRRHYPPPPAYCPRLRRGLRLDSREGRHKRVAVYIDYGVADEAPKGGGTPPAPAADCAVVPTAASGQDVLDSVADLRKDAKSGLLCGIDSYPATGCGDQVKTAPKVADPEPEVEFAIAAATPTPTPAAFSADHE